MPPLLRLGPTFFGRNGIMITLSEGTKATPTFWGSMLELLPMAPRDSSPCHIFLHKRRFPATFLRYRTMVPNDTTANDGLH